MDDNAPAKKPNALMRKAFIRFLQNSGFEFRMRSLETKRFIYVRDDLACAFGIRDIEGISIVNRKTSEGGRVSNWEEAAHFVTIASMIIEEEKRRASNYEAPLLNALPALPERADQ